MLNNKILRNTRQNSIRNKSLDPICEAPIQTQQEDQSDPRWKQFGVIRVSQFIKYLENVGCEIRKAGSHHIRVTNPKYKKQIGESALVDGFATLTGKNECSLKFVKIIINKLGVNEVEFLDEVLGKRKN